MWACSSSGSSRWRLPCASPCRSRTCFARTAPTALFAPLLPAGALSLLLLDSLPMLVGSLASSALVLAVSVGSLGANPVPSVLLAWAIVLMLVLAAAFDDPQRARSVGNFRLTAFACGVLCVFVVGLVGLLGVMPALACAVAVDLILIRSLR